MPGYCENEDPRPFEFYTFKRIASDMVALLATLDLSKAIYIGHDWGSVIVQRVALWYPDHVIAVAALCVPFLRPTPTFISLEEMVEKAPNFTYQLWFANPESEKVLSTPNNIERFLKSLFRVKGDKPVAWNTGKNPMDAMGDPSLGRLWQDKGVWEYFVRSFQKKGSLRGPLTYYKTRGLNYRDELEIVDTARIQCPALFIGAKEDRALPPETWERQQWVPQLERYSVGTGHWCLVEDDGQEIAPLIQSWVAKISKESKL
jgi:soluble epoxide hydrolase/lipid-phosphate phosphatase